MRIEVAKQDLAGAPQLVTPCMGSAGATDDISVHYLFRAKDVEGTMQVEVLTCHSSLFSAAVVPGATVTVAADGPTMFTIEGKRLRQWLQPVSDTALVLDYDSAEAEVTITAPMGSVGFPSLDPTKFRPWDALLLKAAVKATAKAPQLQKAFNFVHRFVGDNQQKPALLVFEGRGGKLLAANPHSAAIVTVPALKECQFRLYGKDGPKFMGFFAAAGEADIEVLETDRAVVFRRPDGALMGETRPRDGFPKDAKAGKDTDKDQHWLELPVADLKRRIQFLRAGAAVEDNRLRLRRDGATLHLSMVTTTGKIAKTTLDNITFGAQEGVEDLPSKGILIPHPILSKLLDLHVGDTFRLGINRRGKSGYFRYLLEEPPVQSLLVMTWLKETRQ